jgi:ABC-2 type transport system ATP-binding protein
MPVIEVDNLTKVFRIPRKDPGLKGAVKALFVPRYEDKVAVDGISFSVEPGEMIGYIGVNGAGKSTTIKMLTGILVPTGGTARVLGRDPHAQRIENAREIGVVFGQRPSLVTCLHRIAEPHRSICQVAPQQYRQLLDEFRDTPARRHRCRSRMLWTEDARGAGCCPDPRTGGGLLDEPRSG